MRLLPLALLFCLVTPGPALAAFPGDNGRIAIVSGDPEAISVVNPDGSGRRALLEEAADPAFSPDGTMIAFVRDGRLFVADATGANEVEVAGEVGFVFSRPAWSPDGDRLVAARAEAARPDEADLYVVQVDGTGLAPLVQAAGDDTAPAWSPDGATIAFETDRDGNREIYVVNADGSNPLNVTNDAGEDTDPDWSPDGSLLVFVSVRGEPAALYTVAPDGNGTALLLGLDIDLGAPAWSPDGMALALTGAGSLWTIASDGTGLAEVTGGADRPAWQPLAEGVAPVAAAGDDLVVECTGPDGATVALDGSGSTDADDAIVLYEWYLDFDGPDEVFLGEGIELEVPFPLDTYVVTLQVLDAAGHAATDSLEVEVRDTVPPAIAVQLSPSVLWPANHRMVPVHATVSATDVCGPVTVVLSAITSSEPDEARKGGDGNFPGDIRNAVVGTDDRDFLLRAERMGSGPGRIYTATYTATDDAENAADAHGQVRVPHDASDRPKPPKPPRPAPRGRGGR